MANPHRGELAFEAGGESYTLQFNAESIVELEEKLDKGIIEIIAEMQNWAKQPELMRFGKIRTLLWAGLRAHHPEIDIKAAGDLIISVDGGFGRIATLVAEGMAKAFNAAEAETKDADPPTGPVNGAGTGSSSTTSVSDLLPMTSGSSPRVN